LAIAQSAKSFVEFGLDGSMGDTPIDPFYFPVFSHQYQFPPAEQRVCERLKLM
jgi:hypothetical protein